MSVLRVLLCSRTLPAGIRTLSEVTPASTTTVTKPNLTNVIPSLTDQCNPVPGYLYIRTESYPIVKMMLHEVNPYCGHEIPEYPIREPAYPPPPPPETGIHAITNEVVEFPYDHLKGACFDENVTIGDLVEVVSKDSEKGPIDIWLDGFEFPGLPKSDAEVYKVKGTDIGEVGPGPDIFRYKDDIPAVREAYLWWRRYGTIRTESLAEEQFDAMWTHFFNNPIIDSFELRRGVVTVFHMDLIAEPTLISQMFYACRRLNDYPMTIRILEAIKDKLPKDPVVYQWMIQELTPTMEELGIKTPESLGLHIAPEGRGPLPY